MGERLIFEGVTGCHSFTGVKKYSIVVGGVEVIDGLGDEGF